MPPTPDDPASAAPGRTAGVRRRLGNRPFFFVLGVIAAAVLTVGWGFALFSYGGNSLGQAYFQTIAWRVVSDTEAQIDFQTNSGEGALCLVSALDEHHVQVGATEVAVEGGVRDVRAEVDTVRRASAVQVVSCREQAFTGEPAR